METAGTSSLKLVKRMGSVEALIRSLIREPREPHVTSMPIVTATSYIPLERFYHAPQAERTDQTNHHKRRFTIFAPSSPMITRRQKQAAQTAAAAERPVDSAVGTRKRPAQPLVEKKAKRKKASAEPLEVLAPTIQAEPERRQDNALGTTPATTETKGAEKSAPVPLAKADATEQAPVPPESKKPEETTPPVHPTQADATEQSSAPAGYNKTKKKTPLVPSAQTGTTEQAPAPSDSKKVRKKKPPMRPTQSNTTERAPAPSEYKKPEKLAPVPSTQTETTVQVPTPSESTSQTDLALPSSDPLREHMQGREHSQEEAEVIDVLMSEPDYDSELTAAGYPSTLELSEIFTESYFIQPSREEEDGNAEGEQPQGEYNNSRDEDDDKAQDLLKAWFPEQDKGKLAGLTAPVLLADAITGTEGVFGDDYFDQQSRDEDDENAQAMLKGWSQEEPNGDKDIPAAPSDDAPTVRDGADEPSRHIQSVSQGPQEDGFDHDLQDPTESNLGEDVDMPEGAPVIPSIDEMLALITETTGEEPCMSPERTRGPISQEDIMRLGVVGEKLLTVVKWWCRYLNKDIDIILTHMGLGESTARAPSLYNQFMSWFAAFSESPKVPFDEWQKEGGRQYQELKSNLESQDSATRTKAEATRHEVIRHYEDVNSTTGSYEMTDNAVKRRVTAEAGRYSKSAKMTAAMGDMDVIGVVLHRGCPESLIAPSAFFASSQALMRLFSDTHGVNLTAVLHYMSSVVVSDTIKKNLTIPHPDVFKTPISEKKTPATKSAARSEASGGAANAAGGEDATSNNAEDDAGAVVADERPPTVRDDLRKVFTKQVKAKFAAIGQKISSKMYWTKILDYCIIHRVFVDLFPHTLTTHVMGNPKWDYVTYRTCHLWALCRGGYDQEVDDPTGELKRWGTHDWLLLKEAVKNGNGNGETLDDLEYASCWSLEPWTDDTIADWEDFDARDSVVLVRSRDGESLVTVADARKWLKKLPSPKLPKGMTKSKGKGKQKADISPTSPAKLSPTALQDDNVDPSNASTIVQRPRPQQRTELVSHIHSPVGEMPGGSSRQSAGDEAPARIGEVTAVNEATVPALQPDGMHDPSSPISARLRRRRPSSPSATGRWDLSDGDDHVDEAPPLEQQAANHSARPPALSNSRRPRSNSVIELSPPSSARFRSANASTSRSQVVASHAHAPLVRPNQNRAMRGRTGAQARPQPSPPSTSRGRLAPSTQSGGNGAPMRGTANTQGRTRVAGSSSSSSRVRRERDGWARMQAQGGGIFSQYPPSFPGYGFGGFPGYQQMMAPPGFPFYPSGGSMGPMQRPPRRNQPEMMLQPSRSRQNTVPSQAMPPQRRQRARPEDLDYEPDALEEDDE
ncbi:hypothetical protein CONPUDRAFT_75820 [Coniophora puteana RWD-64-598 SS2]|uniref:Uncharacterized protein n=1 Tax=Coniophora puteana (strain RWD-64-598) TaxID=741705 RepID=A0A5M3MD24_CONPW|nr:uncharacterized protein CONPUDRAFT_75820 [Coniophora puteana RWD-64-598 SS2]EIW76983.1 hypothetical protein CONPUDRAFT_75820 [Coniophora puteana RWD-64-598 SS2]